MPPYTVNFGGASQPPRYTKTGPGNNVNISHKIRKEKIENKRYRWKHLKDSHIDEKIENTIKS